MATYRICRRLTVKHGQMLEPGSMSSLDWLDEHGLEVLTERGVISRVQSPPLAVLPGWQTRARKIKEVTGDKIENAEQFLEGDDKTLSELMGVQVRTIKKWKKEVLGWLTIEQDDINR